jgi:hypothetical protein
MVQHSVNCFGISFIVAMRWTGHVAAHFQVLLIKVFHVFNHYDGTVREGLLLLVMYINI